jgi:small subunit ribosomal protein S17
MTAPKQEKIKRSVIHRQFEGVVVSAKDKTIHVLIKRKKTNLKYKKQFNVSKKYSVHDEKGEAKVDDIVLFQECRPISKTKRWRLIKVIK